MNNFLKDVLNQPASLQKALRGYLSEDNLKRMADLAEEKFARILFTGMGSSHYCCFGAGIHLNQHGYVNTVMPASQLLHYESELIGEKTLLFIVSQSGESAEIVNLIAKIPQNCRVVAITNNPQSTLARRANFTFLLDVAEEESVTTRTYTSSLILLDLIAGAMTGELHEKAIENIKLAIANMEEFLTNYRETLAKTADFLGVPSYLALIGRGFSYSTVFAGGLFIQEVAKFPALSFDSGAFRHGPFEIVDRNFNGIILAPQGATFDLNYKLALHIADKGAKVLFVTNKEIPDISKNIMAIKLGPVEEMLTPIADIAPVQLVAYHLAESRGIEAGKFRWSSKVTSME